MDGQLADWRDNLETVLRRSVPNCAVDLVAGRLEVVVWEEAAAAAAWNAADELGLDPDLVRVIKPIPFLLPYPSMDDRNEEAWNAFLSKKVRKTDDGEVVLLTGLDPEVDADARILVLGSMPGAESLRCGEYYANARNRFWWIVESLFGIPASAPYFTRVRELRREGVALWDVLSQCSRVGSLDRDIVPSTEVPNDLTGFLAGHPTVRRVVLNGKKAEAAFRRYVGQPAIGGSELEIVAAPSTSPANAGISKAELLNRWRLALTNGGG